MSRLDSLGRLAVAYGRHQLWRRLRRRPAGAARLLQLYEPDRLMSLTAAERDLLPEVSRCINCGLCALAAGRLGKVHLPDLASSYLRPLPLLASAQDDLQGTPPDLERAAAACPVRVPLPELAAMVRRFSGADQVR